MLRNLIPKCSEPSFLNPVRLHILVVELLRLTKHNNWAFDDTCPNLCTEPPYTAIQGAKLEKSQSVNRALFSENILGRKAPTGNCLSCSFCCIIMQCFCEKHKTKSGLFWKRNSFWFRIKKQKFASSILLKDIQEFPTYGIVTPTKYG